MKTQFEKRVALCAIFVLHLAANIANAELVTHWKLDEENSNIATDSSGNGNTGTLHGDLIWSPQHGKYTGSLSFGSTANNNLEIPITKLSAAQGTISLWCYLAPEPHPIRTRYLFGHSTYPYWSNRIQLYLPQGIPPRLNLGLGDSHTRATSIKILQLETWYHIALVWDQGNYAVYVDGIPEAKGTYTGFDQLNSVADIGNDGRTDGTQRNESFYGYIDEVILFNHALNECEIMQLFQGAGDLFISKSFLILLDNIRQAQELINKDKFIEAESFIEKKITEYNQWEEENPSDMGLHHDRLACELYFLLAKTKEITKAPKKDIIKAYKQSVSQLQYRRNYVPALLWLFTHAPTHAYIDAIKKSVNNCQNIPEDLHRIAMDFESINQWDAFELFLNAACDEFDNPTLFAKTIAKGLSKNNTWADSFSKYVLSKPQLIQYYIDKCEQDALERLAHDDFEKAMNIYHHIESKCNSQEDKAGYELKICDCIIKSGEYDAALSKLDKFIDQYKSINKDLIVKSILLKGQVYIQLSEINEASNVFKSLLAKYPDTIYTPEVVFLLGYSYMLQGELNQASETLSLLVKNYPESSYANKARLCLTRIKNIAN